MLIGGLLPCSFIDFPGRLAAVVFTQGCNFRCPYCHNPHLIVAHGVQPVPEAEVFDLLARRRGRLGGVVVTGGEPTRQDDLEDFVARVAAAGFPVKLDTNGSAPEVLARLLGRGLLAQVAMDLKTDPDRYAEAVGIAVDPATIRRSIAVILGSGVEHEFRTTVAWPLHDAADLHRLAGELTGARRLVLQPLRPGTLLDPGRGLRPPDRPWLVAVAREIDRGGLPCTVR